MTISTNTPTLNPHQPWTDQETGWARLEPFASDMVGITHRSFTQLRDHDDLRLTGVGAQACVSDYLLGSACNELNGGGAVQPEQARAAAIGETVERYSVAFVDKSTVIRATPEQLSTADVAHVAPEDLNFFSPEQLSRPGFPFVQARADSVIDWVSGRDLADGTERLVPARMIYMTDDFDDSTPMAYPTSNGLACGCSHEEAVLSGVCELLERDAFTSVWYGKLSLPRIDPRSDDRLAQFMGRHVAPTGVDVELVNLSELVDFPVVLAVVRNPRTPVAPLALGAAAATDPVVACRKAVIEAFQTRTWAKAEQREDNVLDPADGFHQVRSFDDHVRMSLHPATVQACSFLDASRHTVPVQSLPAVHADSPAQAVELIMRRLSDQGVRITAVDVTSPDVSEGGLHVVKSFSAQLSALDSGHLTRFLGHPRLRHRAHQIGLTDEPLTFEELNERPHPFP